MEEELPMYNRLDSVTKRIYTYREAKSLAQLSSDTLDYRRSEFIRIYKQLTYRRNEELLNEGRLKAFKNGRTWKIPKEALRSYVLEAAKLRNL